MVEILQNKNAATRFRILVEIAAGAPGTQQRQIASRLGVTPQAVSEYVRRLRAEGMLVPTGRSGYRVSTRGVNWVLQMLRELQGYVSVVHQAIASITVCAAIAEADIKEGQAVGLRMKDGLLYATSETDGPARGIAANSARSGQDVGVASVEGRVELTRGRVTVLQIPGVQSGGSAQADMRRLRGIDRGQRLGAIGIEAVAALRRAGLEPGYLYGVTEAIIESTHCGLSFTVACTDDAVPALLKRLEEEKLDYELIDLARPGH
jgi:putative transcriptional regulator